jgi:hypothetical protein
MMRRTIVMKSGEWERREARRAAEISSAVVSSRVVRADGTGSEWLAAQYE